MTSDRAASPFLKAEVLLQVAMEAVEDFMRLQARARLGQQGFRQWQKQHAYKIQEVSHVVIQADTRRTYKAFVAAWVISAAQLYELVGVAKFRASRLTALPVSVPASTVHLQQSTLTSNISACCRA